MAGCLTECVQQLYDDEKLQLGVQELIRLQRWQDKTPGNFSISEIFRYYATQYRHKIKINFTTVVSDNNFVIEENLGGRL